MLTKCPILTYKQGIDEKLLGLHSVEVTRIELLFKQISRPIKEMWDTLFKTVHIVIHQTFVKNEKYIL